jgi:hypothetical protein
VSEYEQEYEEGIKIKEVETLLAEETGQVVHTIDYYNNMGKIIKSITKRGEQIPFWMEWEYDENGNNTKFVSKDSNGIPIRITEYKFDENGNEIEDYRKAIRENGEGYWVFLWVQNEYDEDNNMIKSIEKTESGKAIICHYYKYKMIRK